MPTSPEQQLTRIRESGVLAEFEGASPELRESLARVVTASDFICNGLARESSLAHWLVNEAAIQTSLAPGAMAQRLRAALAQAPDLAGFMEALRRHRNREMTRIAWRDLAGWATLAETLADTSAFADAAIDLATEFATQDLARTYGEPRNVAGELQPFIVLGMGKLGVPAVRRLRASFLQSRSGPSEPYGD